MHIRDSIDRILESEEMILGNIFYDVFLNRYPQVQEYFEGVNMQRQAVLLTIALLVIEQYHGSEYPATARYLQELGAKHREWGIPRSTYPYFHDALLDALKQFHGDDWNDQLASEWDLAIQWTIEQMLLSYGDDE